MSEDLLKAKQGIMVNLDKDIHTRLRVLAITKNIPLYKLVEEFMRFGLEHEQEVFEQLKNLTVDDVNKVKV